MGYVADHLGVGGGSKAGRVDGWSAGDEDARGNPSQRVHNTLEKRRLAHVAGAEAHHDEWLGPVVGARHGLGGCQRGPIEDGPYEANVRRRFTGRLELAGRCDKCELAAVVQLRDALDRVEPEVAADGGDHGEGHRDHVEERAAAKQAVRAVEQRGGRGRQRFGRAQRSRQQRVHDQHIGR